MLQHCGQGAGKVDFVECTVDLQANGKAVIGYCVRYTVTEGELYGFYFQGNDLTGNGERTSIGFKR